MIPDIKRVVVLTHGDPEMAREPLERSLTLLSERGIEVLALDNEREKHGALLDRMGGVQVISGEKELDGVGLCLVLGGDGTMLRAFHLTCGRSIPVAGVNLGRVGFLTTVDKDDLTRGVTRLLNGEFTEYPLLGLVATVGEEVYRASNDVVVGKGRRPHACILSLTINNVTLFEVHCDGVVVGTPAGSSAYSLAAGGPLLGISVNAYVISLIAAHAAGVRPVVAAPGDILEIINIGDSDCAIDVDGERLAVLDPGMTARINTTPGTHTLALLEGDSLYHHFRDRLL